MAAYQRTLNTERATTEEERVEEEGQEERIGEDDKEKGAREEAREESKDRECSMRVSSEEKEKKKDAEGEKEWEEEEGVFSRGQQGRATVCLGNLTSRWGEGGGFICGVRSGTNGVNQSKSLEAPGSTEGGAHIGR